MAYDPNKQDAIQDNDLNRALTAHTGTAGTATTERVVSIKGKLRASSMPYTYDIAESNIPNHIAWNKFGQNLDVGASLEEVWDGSAVYEYLGDAAFSTMYISSSNSADQGMAYTVEGIDSDFNFSSVSGTLDGSDGQTFVALTSDATDNKWWRAFRALNTSGSAAAGDIYISKDNTDTGPNGIPDDTNDIQAKILIGAEQTLMSLFTVPVGNTAYLTHFWASTSTNKVTTVNLYVRPFGGVFNIKAALDINQGYSRHHYDFPVPIPAKSDVKIMASAVAGGGKVSAGFDLWYES